MGRGPFGAGQWVFATIILIVAWALACGTFAEARSRDEGAGVVINEVLADPDGHDQGREFVELYNAAGTGIDISGWVLTDRDGKDGSDVPMPELTMPPGSLLVVRSCYGTDELDLSDGSGTHYTNSSSMVLNNAGDDLLLTDGAGVGVDYVAWGNGSSVDGPPDDMDWFGGNTVSVEGLSMARSPDGVDTDSGVDWVVAAPGPGALNGGRADGGVRLLVSAPDHIMLPGEDFVVSVSAFHESGTEAGGTLAMTEDRTGLDMEVNGFMGHAELEAAVGRDLGSYVFDVALSHPNGTAVASFTVEVDETGFDGIIIDPDLPDAVGISWGGHVSGSVMLVREGGVRVPCQGALVTLDMDAVLFHEEAVTDTDGSFRLPFEAPALAGNYSIVMMANSSGGTHSNSTSSWMVVTDNMTLEIWQDAAEADTGSVIVVRGNVWHETGDGAGGAVVVVEFMGTLDKAYDLAEKSGAFEVECGVPGVPGDYRVRVTAVMGDAIVMEEFRMNVVTGDDGGGDPVPMPSAALMMLVAALGMEGARFRSSRKLEK